MKIGFFGAGKVAFSLGKYFAENKMFLSGYYSLNVESAKSASKFTNSNYFTSIEDLLQSSDMILITTPDDYIYESWQKIKSYNIEGKIIAHTSGSLSSKIFHDSKNSGCYCYSIHPIFPFSDKYQCYKRLNTIYFSLEGDDKFFTIIKNTLELIGNNVIPISSENKALYHLSCVMSSNLVLSLINHSTSLLTNIGLSEKEALTALSPLIYSNIDSIQHKGFIESLTGPITRGDIFTVEKHLSVIPKDMLDIYSLLSLNLLNLSKIKNSEKNYTKLESILRGNSQ